MHKVVGEPEVLVNIAGWISDKPKDRLVLTGLIKRQYNCGVSITVASYIVHVYTRSINHIRLR